MVQPPRNPSSTDDDTTEGGEETGRINPFLADVDKLSPQELADYFYALAEEVVRSPEEYKLKMNLTQLDISELDNIDLNTSAGRKKLAKIFRILAEQALRGKEVYQATVVDKSQPKGRAR
jgi:hypothetical protein